jgi:hypothetical protein
LGLKKFNTKELAVIHLLNCVRGYNNTTAASYDEYTPVTFEVPNQVMFHEVGWDDQSTGVARPITAFH